jgi:hypothetical protein
VKIFGWASSSISWVNDATGIMFVAQGGDRKAPEFRTTTHENRQGLYILRFDPALAVGIVWQPPSDDLDAADFAVSATGKLVVQMTRSKAGSSTVFPELHLFNNADSTLTKLPIDGSVGTPRF